MCCDCCSVIENFPLNQKLGNLRYDWQLWAVKLWFAAYWVRRTGEGVVLSADWWLVIGSVTWHVDCCLTNRNMATWRYTESNSAEMADEGAAAAAAAAAGDSDAPSEQCTESSDDDNSIDLSYSDLQQFPHSILESCSQQVRSLQISNNHIAVLPAEVGLFANLVTLDVSNNCLKSIADEICSLRHLRTFVARNNCLGVESIPKDFGTLPSLAVLNLSGNQLTQLPVQFTELQQLKCLYLGANQISTIPPEVQNMSKWVEFFCRVPEQCCRGPKLARSTALADEAVMKLLRRLRCCNWISGNILMQS